MKFEAFFRASLKERFSPAPHPAQKFLKKALFYSLFAPSGQFRSQLAQAAAQSLGEDPKKIFPWAAALEMAHCASLLHDDLPAMDNARIRRGQKCSHLVFGEDIALLAGTCLFVEAFALLTEPVLKPAQSRLLRLLISKTGFHGLISGQAIDLKAGQNRKSGHSLKKSKEKKEAKPSVKSVLTLARLKTSSLIEAAVEGPLLLWGKTAAERKALKKYGQALGLAYQMADDFIDRDSPLKSQKKAEDLLRKFTEESLEALRPLKERGAPLRALSLQNQKRALAPV